MFKLDSSDIERFWSHVRKTKTCWEWTRYKSDKTGYGRLNIENDKRVVGAHRLSYFIAYGSFDHSLFVCHKCDNRSCIKPSHLFLGTSKDNVHDCMKKGRLSIRRLTPDQVTKIRRLHKTGRYNQPRLVMLFKVSRTTIGKIVNNKSWKYLKVN